MQGERQQEQVKGEIKLQEFESLLAKKIFRLCLVLSESAPTDLQ
jgi:hypothetical protein